MSRLALALSAAALVAVAAPASALPSPVTFPTLTYPTQPTPDVGQGCANLTTLSGSTCSVTSK